jgi:hypothetical protein
LTYLNHILPHVRRVWIYQRGNQNRRLAKNRQFTKGLIYMILPSMFYWLLKYKNYFHNLYNVLWEGQITIFCSVGQRQLEDRQTENDKGNYFDMNHLIDWCQVSSISALFLTKLLLQAVNSCVSKKEIWHCIRAVSWLFDCWKTQMVVSVYFVMIHQHKAEILLTWHQSIKWFMSK